MITKAKLFFIAFAFVEFLLMVFLIKLLFVLYIF